jgi:twitching motility protein PilT
MKIEELLEITLERQASDLHLVVGVSPTLRIDGILNPLTNYPLLTESTVEELVNALLSQEEREILRVNRELDFSFELKGRARFRVNAYHQKGTLAAALRLIPMKIKTIDELKLPQVCHKFATLKQGFILITGPTGHGKSTTLAAILNEVNQKRAEHIVTIEDPIEFVLPQAKSIVSQREVHADTHSWAIALRSCLREDPNVVLVGEMRDYETIAAALTVAETGHLVFATLHTNSAAQTIDRIVDVFPEHSKAQVKMQLSATLEAVLAQRLLPCLHGGRIVASELMLASPAIKTSIREGKTHMIDNIIQTSGELGMVPLETDLARLVKEGQVSLETARYYALRLEDLMRLVRGK